MPLLQTATWMEGASPRATPPVASPPPASQPATLPVASPPPKANPLQPEGKECPYSHQSIHPEADRCNHCGENFDTAQDAERRLAFGHIPMDALTSAELGRLKRRDLIAVCSRYGAILEAA